MQRNSYEAVVVGGGMAGTLAAIALARENKSVLLLEKEQCLGGIGTSAMVSELLGVARNGKPIYGGAVKQIFDRMVSDGYAQYHYQVPMSSNPDIHVDRLRCNPEYFKIILEEYCLNAGVEILYDVVCTNVSESESGIELQVSGMYEQWDIHAKFVIDATGNAMVARKMGYDTMKADAENLQVSTLMLRLGNIQLNQLMGAISTGTIQPIISEGFQRGVLKGRIMGFAPIPYTNETTVNVTRTNVNHESASDVSRGRCETHAQINEILAFIRRFVPGCQDAVLSGVAAKLGIRDARRVEGEYLLTEEDILTTQQYEDSAALGAYPLDVHDPLTKRVTWQEVPDIYQIPMRCMIPKGSGRLIVTGRAISATHGAFASIRVMPTVMNLGEAAGCLAVVLLDDKKDLKDIDIAKVHSLMKRHNMNF